MKYLYCTLLIFFVIVGASVLAQPRVNDVATYRLNKVGAHAANLDVDTSFFMTIGDGWRSCSYAKIPSNIGYISSTSAMLSDWKTVFLPSLLPSNDSVALYFYNFKLPSSWGSRRTFVKVGAVSSALSVYVNGRYVGYSEDSFTPAEWDISRYLSSSDSNRLLLVVHPSSTGSLVDSIPLLLNKCSVAPPRGISQPVQLLSLPSTYITDYRVTALVDTLGNGHLEVSVDLSREVSSRMVVEIQLSRTPYSNDSLRNIIFSARRRLDIRDWFTSFPLLKGGVGHVDAWSPQSPNLYYLTILLRAANDSILHTVSQPVGFHSLTISRSMLFLNNASFCPHIQLFYPPFAVSYDSLRTLLVNIKQSNCDMIRLLAPASEALYDVCDSIGIAVWNCCAFSDARSDSSAAANDDFLEHYMYRANNLLHRDRNHPSLFLWGASFSTNPLDTALMMPRGNCLRRAIKFLIDKDNNHLFVMGLAPHPGICYLPYFCYHTPLLTHTYHSICYSSLKIFADTYPLGEAPLFDFEAKKTIVETKKEEVEKNVIIVDKPRKKPSLFRRILNYL